MVYVIDINGHPLMPSNRHGKVRRLIKSNKAKIVKRCPFVIQLLYETESHTQPISLGIDAGSQHVGTSASTDKVELYASDVLLRNDIVNLISTRRECRKSRRNRKTRYRKCRFLNRGKKGWLAPSVRQKIQSHLNEIEFIASILPIKTIIIETASFDIQRIKNPDITGTEYQSGEQLGFWNVREYVLFRDNHQCQCCKGKSGDLRLNVHHIESRKTGGNAPNNLITLCETCHNGYHKGVVKLPPSIRRGIKFNNEAFMCIMRWKFFNEVKKLYSPLGIDVKNTYGYITKNTRITHGLEKEHYIDARCISGHPEAKPLDCVYYKKCTRCHNRQIHKLNPKHGRRQRNQAENKVFGFKLFDKVKYNGIEYFIFGRRSSGYFDIRTFDGIKVNNRSVSYKKLTFLEHSQNIVCRKRLLPCLKARVSDANIIV